ncbi:MAG: phage baseplate assembly protein V [Candidatus Binataceae bacterium]
MKLDFTHSHKERSAFRIGVVVAQDPVNARLRVTFPDSDHLQSWWLPVVMSKTQNDKAYHIPDLGEQVVCLMDEYDEDGAVLGAIYSSVDRPPVGSADKWHVTMKDGAAFEYDRGTHALAVALPTGATMTLSVNSARIEIDASGNVKLMAAGQIQLGGGALKGVARLGDAVTCPAGQGTITSASANVSAD